MVNLLKAINEYRQLLGLNHTNFHKMSDEDKKLVPNWPWYELKQQIRKTPCPVELIVVNNSVVNLANEVVVVGEMGTDEVFRIVVDRRTLIANPDGYIQNLIWEEITKLIDSRLEGLDWDQYFELPYIHPDIRYWNDFVMSKEEFKIAYGIDSAANRSSPEPQ